MQGTSDTLECKNAPSLPNELLYSSKLSLPLLSVLKMASSQNAAAHQACESLQRLLVDLALALEASRQAVYALKSHQILQ